MDLSTTPKPMETPVTAAGRSISGANASRLLAAHESLSQGVAAVKSVLTSTGWLDSELPRAPFNSLVNAAMLPMGEQLAIELWRSRLKTILSLSFDRLYYHCTGEDRAAIVAEMVVLLRSAMAEMPDSGHLYYADWCEFGGGWFEDDSGNGENELTEAVEMRVYRMRLRASYEEFVKRLNHAFHSTVNTSTSEAIAALVDQLETCLRQAVAPTPESTTDSQADNATPTELDEVEAAAGEFEAVWDLALCTHAVDVELAADDDAVPIEGVLFRVDEASECAPAVGPALPLLISNEVAAEALRHVMGRPLDAHESLESHGGGVVGAITEGTLRDRDAVVSGFLHAYHSPKQVQEIRAAAQSGQLGMSMIGTLHWHRGEVDGRPVAVVDRLKLKGGTILRASVATYQKTRVKVLSAVDRAGRSLPVAAIGEPTPVAASADRLESTADNQPSEPNSQPMTTKNLTENPTAVTPSAVASIPVDFAEKLLTAVETLCSRLDSVEAEQQAAKQAEADRLAAEQAAAAEEAQVAAMAAKVAEAIIPTLDERIEKVLGAPRGQAPRRVVAATSVIAGVPSQQTPVAASGVDAELLTLKAQLDRTPTQNTAARIAIADRMAHLLRNA